MEQLLTNKQKPFLNINLCCVTHKIGVFMLCDHISKRRFHLKNKNDFQHNFMRKQILI